MYDSAEPYLSDTERRAQQDESAKNSALASVSSVLKWWDKTDELPDDNAIKAQVKSSLKAKLPQIETDLHSQFMDKQTDVIKQGIKNNDPIVKSYYDSEFDKYLTTQIKQLKKQTYDQYKFDVENARTNWNKGMGEFIRMGGTKAGEETATNLDPGQENQGKKPYTYTYQQARAETEATPEFKSLDDNTLINKWGVDGPKFNNAMEIRNAIEQESDPKYKAVLSNLLENMTRERVGDPSYANGVVNLMNRPFQMAQAPIAGVGRYLQEATQAGSDGTNPTTFLGIDPISAAKGIAKTGVLNSVERAGEYSLQALQDAAQGKTDSTNSVGGVIAHANDQPGDITPAVITNHPKMWEDILQIATPGAGVGGIVGKGAELLSKTGKIDQALGAAKQAITEAPGVKAVGDFFTRNKGAKEVGQAVGGEAGTNLTNSLNAAANRGIGAEAQFAQRGINEIPKDLSDSSKQSAALGILEAAKTFKNDTTIQYAVNRLAQDGLAKATNSPKFAEKFATATKEATGIDMEVVSGPIAEAYGRANKLDKSVNTVVMPTAYKKQLDEFLNPSQFSIGKQMVDKGLIGAKALDYLNSANDYLLKPVNRLMNTVVTSTLQTQTNNLIGNSMLLEVGDGLRAFSPKIQKQAAIEAISELSNGKFGNLTEAGKLTPMFTDSASSKVVTLGDISKAIKDTGLLVDYGRFGAEVGQKSAGYGKGPLAAISRAPGETVGKVFREANQFSDNMTRVSSFMSELNRTKDFSLQGIDNAVQHVKSVIGSYHDMNSGMDKLGRNLITFYGWNGNIVPNMLKVLSKNPQILAKYEQGKQAYGHYNEAGSDQGAILPSALPEWATDRVRGPAESQALLGKENPTEFVMAGLETPLKTINNFISSNPDESIKSMSPLGIKAYFALMTGIDPDSNKPTDDGVVFGKNADIKALGGRFKLFGYTATKRQYDAMKDLYNLYVTKNDYEAAASIVQKFRVGNTQNPAAALYNAISGSKKIPATFGVSQSIVRPNTPDVLRNAAGNATNKAEGGRSLKKKLEGY